MISKQLSKRIISSTVLIPIVLLCLYLGGIPYMIWLSIGTAFVCAEWLSMVERDQKQGVILSIIGLLYFAPAAWGLYWLRIENDAGFFLTTWLLCMVWSSDIAAYFSGKMIGGKKIVPTISPNKTWAGFVGAIIIPMLLSVCIVPFLGQGLNLIQILMLSFFVGLSSQFGDFIISLAKRHVKIKDTGDLIPGHGGFLDRLDSLILAVPVFILLLWVLV